MKIIALVILFVTTIIGCHSPKVNTIHLKGQMADMGTQEVIMEYTGVTGDFGTSLNRIIKTDASGFHIELDGMLRACLDALLAAHTFG